MGMFDSVYFPCKTVGCNGEIEAQSKAGDCCLHNYTPDDVPAVIAIDIAGQARSCYKCGEVYKVSSNIPIPVAVRMWLE